MQSGSHAHWRVSALTEPTLRDIEMSFMHAAFEKHNGIKPAASRELGISLQPRWRHS